MPGVRGQKPFPSRKKYSQRKRRGSLKGNQLIQKQIQKEKKLGHRIGDNIQRRIRRSTRYSYRTSTTNENLSTKKKTKILYTGFTSEVAGHRHRFVLYSDYTVTIKEAVHPDTKAIRHGHYYNGRYDNGYVTQAASSCWPNCEKLYGYQGAPHHGHELIFENGRDKEIVSGKTLTDDIRTISKDELLVLKKYNKLLMGRLHRAGLRVDSLNKIHTSMPLKIQKSSQEHNQVIDILYKHNINYKQKGLLTKLKNELDAHGIKKLKAEVSSITTMNLDSLISMIEESEHQLMMDLWMILIVAFIIIMIDLISTITK